MHQSATRPREAERPASFEARGGPSRIDLRRAGIVTVLWATGYRRAYPFLQVPGALDTHGELIHEGGLMSPPGLYALGLQMMRRRNSSFIDGVGLDAREVTDHLVAFLNGRHSDAA